MNSLTVQPHHVAALAQYGRAFPLEPLSDEDDWTCGHCGAARRMRAYEVGMDGRYWQQSEAVRPYPVEIPVSRDDAGLRLLLNGVVCGEQVPLRTVTYQRWYASTTFETMVVGPCATQIPLTVRVVEDGLGPCPGNRWVWARESEYRQQQHFLLEILPLWMRYLEREKYVTDSALALLGEDRDAVVIYTRLARIETALQEIADRLNTGGAGLLGIR